MKTYTINVNVPSDWAELGDKRLRYVYELIAEEFSCKRAQRSSLLEPMPSAAENGPGQYTSDELKLLCLLRWSDTKVVGRQESGAYLLRKGSMLFEATPLTLAELLPHLD